VSSRFIYVHLPRNACFGHSGTAPGEWTGHRAARR